MSSSSASGVAVTGRSVDAIRVRVISWRPAQRPLVPAVDQAGCRHRDDADAGGGDGRRCRPTVNSTQPAASKAKTVRTDAVSTRWSRRTCNMNAGSSRHRARSTS
jgi:hypothetical protein